MTTGIANSKTTDEAQIRALIDDRAKAVRDDRLLEQARRTYELESTHPLGRYSG